MFNFYGGTPQIIIPDNLKAGVISPDLYNPEINKAYQQMARHYNTIYCTSQSKKAAR